ncbi:MAG: hypothetical protein ABTQ31_14455 [Rhizobiaceae bacterium]
MTFRLKLPGGTLKVKRKEDLRKREQQRQVPVWKLGGYFIVWWPDSMPSGPSSSRRGTETTGS